MGINRPVLPWRRNAAGFEQYHGCKSSLGMSGSLPPVLPAQIAFRLSSYLLKQTQTSTPTSLDLKAKELNDWRLSLDHSSPIAGDFAFCACITYSSSSSCLRALQGRSEKDAATDWKGHCMKVRKGSFSGNQDCFA